MSLRDRCRDMVVQIFPDAILRQGSPVDDLVAFVQSEIGRTGDDRLKNSKSLILYFKNKQDRDEFKDLILQAKPNMKAKDIP